MSDTTLRGLVHDPAVTLQEIGDYLDGLTAEARVAQMYTMRRKDQKALWDKAAPGRVITMDHFVPAGTPPRTEVIHDGINTLPVFRKFQKRFCRCAEGDTTTAGYNEGATRWILGPGYFVNRATAGNPGWEERGDLVVDYFQVPEAPVVPTWPKVKPNSQGLQRLVYYQTRDFMRRVSHHVSIGTAYKVEKPLNAWFMLCRRD
jgi:hypothetical protein